MEKNIHTNHPSEKLRPKHFGPFEIIDTIGTINFKLKLPNSWKCIHNIFHASQLTPYKENKVYSPNYPKLASDLIKGKKNSKSKQLLEPNTLDNGRYYNTWSNGRATLN